MKNWRDVLAPARTPRPLVDTLSNELATILRMPDIREKLAAQGLTPWITTPAQLAALMRADMAKYANIMRTANIGRANGWGAAHPARQTCMDRSPG